MNAYRIGAVVCLVAAGVAAVMGTVTAAAAEAGPAAAVAVPGEPMAGLLVVIAVELAVLLVFVAAAVVAFLDLGRRVTAALRRIEAHAEQDSNESLPAIRSITSDVLTLLEGGRA